MNEQSYSTRERLSFHERLRRIIVVPQHHSVIEQLPAGYKSDITIFVGVKLSIKDRFRILMGGIPEFRVNVVMKLSEEEIAGYKTTPTSFIIK